VRGRQIGTCSHLHSCADTLVRALRRAWASQATVQTFWNASVHFRRPHSHSPLPLLGLLCLSPPTGDFSSATVGDLARRESHIQGVIAHRGEHTLPPWAVYYPRKCTDEHFVRFFFLQTGALIRRWNDPQRGECGASLHIEPFVPGISPDTNGPYHLYRRTCTG
jgi:hypothetical protein